MATEQEKLVDDISCHLEGQPIETVRAVRTILAVLQSARLKHPDGYAGPHEAYAIVKEELDEFWDEVRGNGPRGRMYEEMADVAVTALRSLEMLQQPEEYLG